MPAQKPSAPSGQEPGSLRTNMNAASPRNTSGQWRAQRTRPSACTSDSRPIASTKSPETWWLNSDHPRSASVRGAFLSSAGSASRGGDDSVGQRGVKRATTSAGVARSATTSMAGGSEVSDAAANSTVRPRPSSTSTKRRKRSGETASPAGSRRTAKKFSAPSARSSPSMTALVMTIRPYAVPISPRALST